MGVATLDMPSYCFDVVLARLNGDHIPRCPSTIPNLKFPLFVTWKKGSAKHLRGCIGTFSHLSLHEGLSEYAQTSAFRDTRFDPISVHEVPQLHCSVSLLVQFEPAANYLDWSVGVHGIRIEYMQHGRKLNAVYLPEVAIEQGWDHVTTLDHLMQKGGFQGLITENDRLAVRIERFQSEKTGLSYEDYCALKKRLGQPVAVLNGHRNGIFRSCRP